MALEVYRTLFASDQERSRAELEGIAAALGVEPGEAAALGEFTALGVARTFAERIPDATVEDQSSVPFSGMWARVVFTHQGVPLRLCFDRYPNDACGVSLHAPAPGKYGEFSVVRWDEEQQKRRTEDGLGAAIEARALEGAEDEEDEERLFLSNTCFLQGDGPRVAAARFRSLSEEHQLSVLALCGNYEGVRLENEVVSVDLCDIFRFVELSAGDTNGAPFPIAIGAQLALVAQGLPVQSREHTELAEAQECRYCNARYVFTPQQPACRRCGTPPGLDVSSTKRA